MGSFRGFRKLGAGGVTVVSGGGGEPPVEPYEAPISGTSGSVTGATHGQGTTPTVVFKRNGTAFETAYSINPLNGDVSWTSYETLNASTDTILITG